MSFQSPKLTRRAFNGGLAAAAGLLAMPAFLRGASAQQGGYPSRSIRVIIPTGQGGGAELLARAFDRRGRSCSVIHSSMSFIPAPPVRSATRCSCRSATRTATTCCSATWARK